MFGNNCWNYAQEILQAGTNDNALIQMYYEKSKNIVPRLASSTTAVIKAYSFIKNSFAKIKGWF